MKSKLIPKNKMWISLMIIIVPLLIMVLLKSFNYNESDSFKSWVKLAGSLSLVGLFTLFMTQWTKDDGDEMHLKFRLVACIQGIIYGIGYLLIMSVFELFGIETFDFPAHGILFMILLWMLYCLGNNIYKSKKELTKSD